MLIKIFKGDSGGLSKDEGHRAGPSERKMKLSAIQGKYNPEYNDVEVRLLIKESRKTSNQPAQGDLARVLKKVNLDDNATYWELKKAIWKYLEIKNPIKLPVTEKKTIFERQIDNAAEITILRDKEGLILTSIFILPEDPDKEDLDKELVKKLLKEG